MESYVLNEKVMNDFKMYLIEEERSVATINKYLRDVKKFHDYLKGNKCFTKEQVIAYKANLIENYKISSINSMLVALNTFMNFLGAPRLKVKLYKVQRKIFQEEDKELTKDEYQRLLEAASSKSNERLYMLMQAICSTGIRVSEHRFITVEAIKEGQATIYNKGKVRIVLFHKRLRKILLAYSKRMNIEKGPLFITRSGKPLDRSNIWSMMKKLCEEANVNKEKVYPHNLRHLFALTYYRLEKDLVRLADLLGHASIDTTRIYTMTSGNEYEKKLSRLNLLSMRC